MGNQKERATQGDGSRKRPSARTVAGSVAEVTERSVNQSYRCRCPSCGRNALDLTRKPHRDGAGLITVVYCFGCGARGPDVSEASGIPEWKLYAWPPPEELGAPVDQSCSAASAEPPPLPTQAQIDGWHSRLLSHRPALDYLFGRGVSLQVVKRYRLGWDGDRQRLTFPMQGGLLKTREPRDGAQMRCWPGRNRPWPLYPRVPRGVGWALLVAGELDALCGLSAGLPAVSVTLGAGTWLDSWTDELRGRLVVVCFDNDEAELAERRVRELRAAGIDACQLNLRTLGLIKPKGDLSDFLIAGGDFKRPKLPGRSRA